MVFCRWLRASVSLTCLHLPFLCVSRSPAYAVSLILFYSLVSNVLNLYIMTTRDFLNAMPDLPVELKRDYLSHMSGCIAQSVFHKPCPRGSYQCIDCFLCSYK